MKIITILLFCATILVSSCKKDDEEQENPADALPPATQIGAQTFGCLIDGKPFFPDKIGGNRPSAFYQFVDGAYTFIVSASRDDGGGELFKTITIGGIDVEKLKEGPYNLKVERSQNFFGFYLLGGGLVLDSSSTDENPGNLIITRLDEEEFIISGTFEFTVLDNDGNEIKITDGRFDLNYTN
jgi:hypothetical protein